MSAEPARKHPSSAESWPKAGSGLPARERTNDELVEMMRDDPVRAAPLLYDRFADEVNRLVWRLLGADSDHNDLVQQVFYRVMLNGRQVREPERLGGWIRAVTVHTVYGELRRRDLRRFLLREVDEGEPHADLVRDVEARDLLLRARSILSKLPAKERIVFSLHFIEERSLAEIAELCGFSLATAKRRLKRANRRFSALVAQYPELSRLMNREEA